MMKKLATIALLGLGMWLSSCASNTVAPAPRTGAGGNWEAQLTGGTGQAALLDFVSNFSVGFNGGTLDINSFSFFNANTCFSTTSTDSTEQGSAVLNTSASNQVTGSLTYQISGAAPSGSVLTLTSYPAPIGLTGTSSNGSNNGALTNGVVTGTWSLTSSNNNTDCDVPSGTFVMCQEAEPNSTGGCGAAAASASAKRAHELNEP
jgi:hypothetical protein